MQEGKRFYKNVAVGALDNGYGVFLDGRKIISPLKKPIVLPTKAAAQLVADEWQLQGEKIDANLMPLTRLVNVAIDKAHASHEQLANEIKKYASSDLLCYRVSSPSKLAHMQHEAWEPSINWIREKHGLEFTVVMDSFKLAQSDMTLEKIKRMAKTFDDLRLTALAFATQITGSAILGLALKHGFLDGYQVFRAIRVEEDYNAQIWGYDPDDLAKAESRQKDIVALYKLFRALEAK